MKPKNKILIVDDNPANTTVLKEILKNRYQIKKAPSGEKAIEMVSDFKPDLILLDTKMTGIDGFETCSNIRSIQQTTSTKIIMISSDGSVSERLRCYKIGADDYMIKPFEEQELLAKVGVYLRLKSVEEIDQLKSNLLTFLHHETNTPLNSIIAPVETLLENEDMSPQDRRKWLEMNYQSALRLQSLLEKAMTLCAIKSGKLKFNFELADLCSVVRDSLVKVKTRASNRGVKIDLQLPDTAMTRIDREQITRVVTTILDNAIRFTPEEGAIEIGLSVDSTYFNLVVTDKGKGIHPDYLPFIFDEFSDPGMKYHSQGHGLSLAIGKHIIEQHNGIIDVRSVIDNGASFIIKIPV